MAFIQISIATFELYQKHETILPERKELAKIAHAKMFLNGLEDNKPIYEASEERL